MNNCLNCGKPVINKYCNTSCQNRYQNNNKINRTQIKLITFTENCNSCGKSFNILETEKKHSEKEKYYCNRSCANKREHSQETKDKIRETLNRINTLKKHNDVKLICQYCQKEFTVIFKKRKQKTCSRTCKGYLVNKNRIYVPRPLKKNIINKKEIDLNKKTFIYSLEYPIGDIRYIGKSDNPSKRLKKHIIEASSRKKSHKDNWINCLNDIPLLNIIEEVEYSIWQEREIYWIKYYKNLGFNLVNGTDGGEGSNGFKGKHHTPETKLKLAEKSKGKKITDENRVNITGENNSNCKISDNDAIHIFYLFHIEKLSHRKISKIYNISSGYISTMLSGKKRKYIYDEYMKKY